MDAYEQGRKDCKDGCSIDDIPQSLFSRRQRSDWRDGWLDQYYASRHEPKGKDIKRRIWPEPL